MSKMLNTNKIGAISRSWRIADASVVGGKTPTTARMEREIIRLRTINPAANIEVIYKARSFTSV